MYDYKTIILKAIQRSNSWILKFFFGSITATLGTFFYFWKVEDKISIWTSIIIGLIFMSIAWLSGVLLYGRKEFIKARKVKGTPNIYGDAILKLNEACSEIQQLRRVSSPTPQQFIDTLTVVCSQLREIFFQKTKHKCSICIKVITDSEATAGTTVVTLARDSKAHEDKKRQNVDKRMDVLHPIDRNTCFRNIFNYLGEKKGRAYFNNDLPAEGGYENTSFNIHGDVEDGLVTEERRKKWTLPYRSEIVVPICPLNHLPNANERKLLYGFLCLDSVEPNVFNERYDIEILRGIADDLFDIIGRYIALRNVQLQAAQTS